MAEKFNLKWNDFSSTVSNSFANLRREKEFFDVTLVTGDEIQIPAHKLVLSACSGFFKSILSKNVHSHPLLYLSGVSSGDLTMVLDYIYQGEVQIHESEMETFLKISEQFRIQGLMSKNIEQRPPAQNIKKKKRSNETPAIEVKAEPPAERELEEVSDTSREMLNVSDMAEGQEKILELLEKRDGLYHCTVCGYEKKDKTKVTRHIERHVEGLAYSCELCHKTFRSKNAKYHHSKRAHEQ